MSNNISKDGFGHKFQERIDYYYEKLINPDPFDKYKVEVAIKHLYNYVNCEEPEIIFANNVLDCYDEAHKYFTFRNIFFNRSRFINALILTFKWIPFVAFKEVSLCEDNKFSFEFKILKDLIDCCQIFVPLQKVCFVPFNYVKLSVKSDNYELHNENGPAIEYLPGKNNSSLYFLNDILVPEELVMTPADKLSPELYKQERNADVRTEILRKIGIDKFIDEGQIIDSWEYYDDSLPNYQWWKKSEYKVIDMHKLFPGVVSAPHLYMKNQTTGVYHLEPVAPTVKTISDALTDRFGGIKESEYIIMSIK